MSEKIKIEVELREKDLKDAETYACLIGMDRGKLLSKMLQSKIVSMRAQVNNLPYISLYQLTERRITQHQSNTQATPQARQDTPITS